MNDTLRPMAGPEGGFRQRRFQVLIASRSAESVSQLQVVLGSLPHIDIEVRTITNGHTDPLFGLGTFPDLLVFRVGERWEMELEAISHRPPSQRPAMIVVSDSVDPAVMRTAMQAGARDFFGEPMAASALLASVEHLYDEMMAGPDNLSGRITVVVNGKGGSGASLVASNTAHLLASEQGCRVVLVDLDLQFGSLCHYLDLRIKHGIKEALDNMDDLDALALDGYLAKHPDGLRVMGAEEGRIVLTDEVSGERLLQLIRLLARYHEHIVIDLPRQIDLITSTVLEHADQVVIVTQQSITHLRDTARLMDILRDDLEVDSEKMVVVVNRFQKSSEITCSEIENALKHKTLVRIPNDYSAVTESLNDGVPISQVAKRSPVSRALLDLSEVVMGRQEEEVHGVLGRFFSKLTGA